MVLKKLNDRINKWKKFTVSVNKDYPFISKIDKDTRFCLQDLLNKGNMLQKKLNYINSKEDFRFKEVMRIVNLQEMIINDIIEFRKEIINFQKQELKEQKLKEKKNNKKTLVNLF